MAFFPAFSSVANSVALFVGTNVVRIVGILLEEVGVDSEGVWKDVSVGSAVIRIGEVVGTIVGCNLALPTMGLIVGSRTTFVELSVNSIVFSVSAFSPSPSSASVVPSTFASSDLVNTNSHSVFAKTPSQSFPPWLFVAVFPPPSAYCPPSVAN